MGISSNSRYVCNFDPKICPFVEDLRPLVLLNKTYRSRGGYGRVRGTVWEGNNIKNKDEKVGYPSQEFHRLFDYKKPHLTLSESRTTHLANNKLTLRREGGLQQTFSNSFFFPVSPDRQGKTMQNAKHIELRWFRGVVGIFVFRRYRVCVSVFMCWKSILRIRSFQANREYSFRLCCGSLTRWEFR